MLATHYKRHKTAIQMLIDRTRDERFEIQESMRVSALNFYGDGEHDMGYLMTITTREKLHRFLDESLRSLKRCEQPNEIHMHRIGKLVPLYITQLRKMKAGNIKESIEWYTDMHEALIQAAARLEVLQKLSSAGF